MNRAGHESSAVNRPAMIRRGRQVADDRGAGLVVGITLMFAFTFLGLVWLARDVDRAISNRSAAQAIAFQAARSGAQAAVVPGLRGGELPTIDESAAVEAAARTATALFGSYGVSGRVTSISVAVDDVTVSVAIDDAGRTVTGVGTVRAERAP
jgi:Tfp pilus assembly protein PilX